MFKIICPSSANLFQKSSPQGRGCDEAPAHQDEEDAGRMQCVIALAPGAFDIWPGSHKLGHKKPPCEQGHYHVTEDFQKYLEANCEHVVCACQPGDLLVFLGGHFVHGSPAIGGQHPSPRVMTYATYWPPGTKKGMAHKAGKCLKPHCNLDFQVSNADPS